MFDILSHSPLRVAVVRESHAKVRSTTQRRGKTWKPLTSSQRLTISKTHKQFIATQVISLPR